MLQKIKSALQYSFKVLTVQIPEWHMDYIHHGDWPIMIWCTIYIKCFWYTVTWRCSLTVTMVIFQDAVVLVSLFTFCSNYYHMWLIKVECYTSLNFLSPPEQCGWLEMLLGSLDRRVKRRTHMYKGSRPLANGNLQRFPTNWQKKKKKILAEKVEIPLVGMTCLFLEATGSLRLQGRQYYIQCNR